jgi:mono/diheme cytochrome c family protein
MDQSMLRSVAISSLLLTLSSASAQPKQVAAATPAAAPAKQAAATPASAAVNVIEMWVRAPGNYGTGPAPAKQSPRKIDLASLPAIEVEHLDIQYEGVLKFKGVGLQALINAYSPPSGVDTALLRFKNGMVVAMPLQPDAFKRLDPFVALSVRDSASGQYQPLPEIKRSGENFVDMKGIAFVGNKLVVKDRWHPQVPADAQPVFSPWLQTDSLTGIEFVVGARYLSQFHVDAESSRGWELFTQSCNFCHGARKTGAGLGWDFVEPVPLYTYRETGKRLLYHIKYRSDAEALRGALMPALKHVTEEQAAALWLWLRAVATKPLVTYTP